MRLAFQSHFRASPPSMTASEEPIVEVPVALEASGRIEVRCVEQVGDDGDAAFFDGRGQRVLVFVDHVLVERLGHQLLGLGIHPGGDERGEVEAGVPVEHEFVVDESVCDFRIHRIVGHLSGPARPKPQNGRYRPE